MPSKRSCFNSTLYRKLLSRFWPMWAGVTVLASLAPLVVFLTLLQPDAKIFVRDAETMYYGILTIAAPAGMLVYAIICAMAVWGYLYQSRSVALMHALPATRTCLFLTGCAAGFTFLLLPLVIAGCLLFLVTAAFGAAAPMAFLQCAAGLVLLALLYFGIATLCAMVTGHQLALPVFYLLANFLEALLDLLLTTFAGSFLFGVTGGYSGALEWLSPTIFIYRHLSYEQIWEPTGDGGRIWVGVELQGLPVLLAYGLVGALLLAAAWLLYRRRASESAGDVVACRSLRFLFKLGLGVFLALSAGQMLYEILRLPLVDWDQQSLPLMGLCLFLAGTAGFWIADMLVQKSLRVLKTTAVGAGVMAALALAVCLTVRLDLLGIERRVPDQEEVADVYLLVSGVTDGDIELTAGREDEYIARVLAIHRDIVARRTEIRRETEESGRFSGAWEVDEDGNALKAVWPLNLTYQLKNGTALTRQYFLPIEAAMLEEPGNYAALLSELINEPEIQLKRLFYNEGFVPVWANLCAWDDATGEELDLGVERDLSQEEATRLYEAVAEDAKAGRWGHIDLLSGGTRDVVAPGTAPLTSSLEINFDLMQRGNGLGDTRSKSIYIVWTPAMTATTQALLDLGVDPALIERLEGSGTMAAPGGVTTAVPAGH